MSNLNNKDNITFFLEENDDDKNNEEEIQRMMEDFTGLSDTDSDTNIDEFNSLMYNDNDETNMEYFLKKSNFGNDELFYEEEYTVKELLKICSYYGLDKNIRTSKCKKQDIIATLVYFESLPENTKIVQKRNRMWAYITELLHEPKMKKFIIWN